MPYLSFRIFFVPGFYKQNRLWSSSSAIFECQASKWTENNSPLSFQIWAKRKLWQSFIQCTKSFVSQSKDGDSATTLYICIPFCPHFLMSINVSLFFTDGTVSSRKYARSVKFCVLLNHFLCLELPDFAVFVTCLVFKSIVSYATSKSHQFPPTASLP